ncbi:MAG: hypothetical protein R3E64_13585 [Halioglobus sp.]
MDDVPQMLWLGANLSGIEPGEGVDAWQASGREIHAAFDQVVACIRTLLRRR